MKRPEVHEYHSDYATYVDLVPEGDIVELLKRQLEQTSGVFNQLTDNQSLNRYAPEKWSLKELLGHMTDTERVMSYRLLSVARGDSSSLPGFNEGIYVRNASFDEQKQQDLLEGFTIVRQATLSLLAGLSEEAWSRSGKANDNRVTATALAYIIAGHELHHNKIIKERYLSAMKND